MITALIIDRFLLSSHQMVVRLKVKAGRGEAERISFILSVRQFESNYVREPRWETDWRGKCKNCFLLYVSWKAPWYDFSRFKTEADSTGRWGGEWEEDGQSKWKHSMCAFLHISSLWGVVMSCAGAEQNQTHQYWMSYISLQCGSRQSELVHASTASRQGTRLTVSPEFCCSAIKSISLSQTEWLGMCYSRKTQVEPYSIIDWWMLSLRRVFFATTLNIFGFLHALFVTWWSKKVLSMHD